MVKITPIFLMITSCATPMTELEREFTRQQLREDYALCRQIHTGIWYSDFISDPRREPSYLNMRFDFNRNGCPMILRQACKRGTPFERC